jgi:hypothetical protein
MSPTTPQLLAVCRLLGAQPWEGGSSRVVVEFRPAERSEREELPLGAPLQLGVHSLVAILRPAERPHREARPMRLVARLRAAAVVGPVVAMDPVVVRRRAGAPGRAGLLQLGRRAAAHRALAQIREPNKPSWWGI